MDYLEQPKQPPRQGHVRVQIGTAEYEFKPEELVKRLCEHKARPEAAWISPYIRFIDREYVEGPNGTFEEVYIVVTETPPGVRSVKVQKNFDKYHGYLGEQDYVAYDLKQLAFPYLVNIFVFKVQPNGSMILDPTWALSFYRTMPLSGFSDDLYICNLPNITVEPWSEELSKASIGWTCFHNAAVESITAIPMEGQMGHSGESKLSVAARLAQQILNYFWDAVFTASQDTLSAFSETAKVVNNCASMAAWEKASAEEPDFPLYEKWLPHPDLATLGDVVKTLHDALNVVPHNGFSQGEEPIIPAGEKISVRRLRVMFSKRWNRAYKFY